MIVVKPPKKKTVCNVSQLEAEIYSAVRPLLIVSEIFVCAPMGAHSLVAPIDGDRKEFLRQAAHLAWCILVYSCLSVCIYTEYTESNIDLPTVQKPLYFCEYLVYFVHIFQIIVATQRARHKFRQYLCTIVDFNWCLVASFDMPPQCGAYAKFLGRHLLLIALHFVCTLIVDYFYSGILEHGKVLGFMRSSTVYLLPNLIMHLSLTQYYGLLYAIFSVARQLNGVLQANMNTEKKDERTLHADLREIRLLYSRLEVFTRDVNEAFGQSIVLVYIGSFMNVSVNIFLIYKYIENRTASDWAWTMYSVVWTVMHVGKMFLILYYNYCIQDQKDTTALLLNDFKGQSSDMEETLTHFILQLIINTRSNVVCGIAVLNMDFITSLLVAVSTLFIFLLQYDITFEALTRTHKSAIPNRNS